MRIAIALALLFSAATVDAQSALDADGSVVLVAPESSLGFALVVSDLPPEASVSAEMALPLAKPENEIAAWSGAKRGATIGLVVGAMLVATAIAIDADKGGCSPGDYFCATPIAVLATIPITLTGAAIGGAIGWSASVASGPAAP